MIRISFKFILINYAQIFSILNRTFIAYKKIYSLIYKKPLQILLLNKHPFRHRANQNIIFYFPNLLFPPILTASITMYNGSC